MPPPEKFSKLSLGFTLAEVLITLGIIGVVAALTIPTLIEKYKTKTTAVKLEKFYTIMSQAVLRWRNEEGITDDFFFPDDTIKNAEKSKIWYTNNLKPYINTQLTDGEKLADHVHFAVNFNDGTGFVSYIADPHIMYFFYCTKFQYCELEHYDGKRTFLFSLYNGNFYTSSGRATNLSRESLLDRCKNPSDGNPIHRHDCARLIQYDGWEIKPDYPIKL